MSEDNKNKTRSKLTLKLKPSSIDPKNIGPSTKSNTQDKKLGSSSVQVTIKGRKKDVPNEEASNSSLSQKELETRMKAISGAKKDDVKPVKDLNKIIKESKKSEEKPKVEVKENVKAEVKSEVKVEVKAEIKPEKKVEEKTLKASPEYNPDSFNVRNKIKNSIEITNRENEEKQRLQDERRKKEQEEQAQAQKAKKKPKKEFNDDQKKSKPDFKKGRGKNRKLTTYIVDDESSYSSRKRKKSKGRVQEQPQEVKEYKKVSREVALPELLTVSDLSERMSEKAGDVVKKLFSMGMVVTTNQVIDADTADIIIEEFGHTSKRVSHSDVENVFEEDAADIEQLSRAPIVTIMGHVDHGKTSLLDALRSTDIVGGESGGITQHIGASRVKTKSGKHITFLDTPGHEAFTEMRLRGAHVTDIVILVVAADDGVKAQTIEAINHAKAAEVPIIVAVNKIDKPGADPSRAKNELLAHEIVAEDMGGDIMFVEVSAKAKTNLDKLEEVVLLQAEMLDLKSPYEGKSSGIVIESRVDPAKGVVVTLLVQKGSLDVTDLIVAGTAYGKVRKMTDERGKNVKIATPSVAVEVLGLDTAPSAGERFVEVDEEKQAREIISYRSRKEKEERAMRNSAKSLANIFKESGVGKLKYLNIVIKADVHGSIEAIQGSLEKLNTDEVAIKVVHLATGGINESDINLAAVSDAVILGFNVRANPQAKDLARSKNIDIRYYSIIYNLVDDMKLLLSGMLDPTKTEEYLGQAEIRQVFKLSGVGKIAGGFVTDGMIKRNAKVRLLRDDVVIHEGILKTLKRFKDDQKEVKNGFECGFSIDGYDDIKEGDSIECFNIIEEKRSL